MRGIFSRVQRFLVDDDGPTAVEYAVMLAMIVAVCLTAVRGLGATLSGSFSSSLSTINGS